MNFLLVSNLGIENFAGTNYFCEKIDFSLIGSRIQHFRFYENVT